MRERSKEQNWRGPQHPNWKGGRHPHGNGYMIVLSPDHPRAHKKGYMMEHILVMEAHLGRYILRSETVHHLNGDKQDNRLENLELWDHGHPKGQRHSDKMKFYMSELLKKCDRKTLFKFCSEVVK